MFYCPPRDIHVSIDVGCKRHQVAFGLSEGQIPDEFSITHRPEGFTTLFKRLLKLGHYQCPIRVAKNEPVEPVIWVVKIAESRVRIFHKS